MRILRKQLGVSVLAVSMLLMGCATRGYVRRQVATVDNKVSQLSTTVQENTERIDATDARARQGIADAAAAHNTATAALNAANQANSTAAAAQAAAASAQGTADAANQSAQAANSKAGTIDSRVSSMALVADKYGTGATTMVMFKSGKADLSKEGKQALDELIGPLTKEEASYLVEVHGFASAEGAESANVNLSQERSENVQRYMVNKGASLSRISVVGHGAENPIADNNTKQGREQNRRAEIRVFWPTK